MSKQIVDLELNDDGSYAPKRETIRVKVKNSKGKGLVKVPIGEKPKFVRESHADDFLQGIDVGLDFIDNVMPRVERFLRLRG